MTTSPPRVLFLDHTATLGGGEIALLNLVRALDRSRYIPVIVLFSDGPLRQQLIDAGGEVHLLPLAADVVNTRKDSLGGSSLLKIRTAVTTFAFAMRLSRLIRRLDVAIVHTNSLKSDLIGAVAARLARRPVLWHVRDRINSDYLPAKVVKVFRLLARRLPNRVIANSAATLSTLLPSPGPRYCVIHDGTPERTDVIAHSNEQPIIGLVGRISPWKGQDVFIRAAAKVREHFPAVRFQIIGAALFDEATYEKRVRDLVVTLGLQDAVEFTGFRSDVPQLIDRLDVLVHASTVGEPFGQVVIEGMAAGRPVVATRGGGVPEIITDGESGLLVPMGDVDAMAAAIAKLLADPQGAQAMGERGRQRVLDQFTIQHVARNVEKLYDDVLKTK